MSNSIGTLFSLNFHLLYCCLYYIISGEEGYDMKKIAALFLSLMIISPTVFADDDITVYLNEDELIFEQ